MKIIQTKGGVIPITTDTTNYSTDTTFLLTDITLINDSIKFIYFVPRFNVMIENYKVDGLEIVLVDEFLNKPIQVNYTLETINQLFVMNFIDNVFTLNHKYSIQMKINGQIWYEGKILYTNKNKKEIQDFRFTTIEENKMKL